MLLVGFLLLYLQPVCLVDEQLARRLAPGEFLASGHRLGLRPVDARGLGRFAGLDLPPPVGVGLDEVGLQISLPAQHTPLGFETLITADPADGFAHPSHGLVQRVFGTASFLVGHHDSFLLPLGSPSTVRYKHAEAVTLSGFLVLHRWTMGAATGAVADATAEGASLPHLTSYLLACAT